MTGRLPLLLLLAAICLACMLVSFSRIRRAEALRLQLAGRMSATLKRHQSGAGAAEAVTPMRVSVAPTAPRLGGQLAALLGADLSRAELYPVKWWLVPLIAVVPAWLGAKLIGFLAGPLVLLATPLIAWIITYQAFQYFHGRRVETLFRQFPDALAMIVRSVRVGIPVNEAMRAVARQAADPTATEFSRLADEVSIGAPLDQALRAMAERNKVAEYRFFATALSLQSQTGGGISETLENLAEVIRKRVAARARGKALAAEARASASALAVLPLLALGGLWMMNPGYIDVLFIDPLGNKILAAGALLLGTGIVAMKLIIQKSLS